MGFEPTTPGTTIQCSNQLSYNHHVLLCFPLEHCKGNNSFSIHQAPRHLHSNCAFFQGIPPLLISFFPKALNTKKARANT